MAHHTLKSSYDRLIERINKFPQGAPPSETLYRILQMLFSEREAELVSQLPIKPFDAEMAAQVWNLGVTSARKHLDELASRAVLLDIVDKRGNTTYMLPPPMAGFFEFSMMRVSETIDQKLLSELFHQYLNVEEDFIKDLFTTGETQLGRTFVQESALPDSLSLRVMDYERATEVIKTATHIGVSMCYCRHKAMHLDRACSAPMDICMTFNASAASLTRHGHARTVDAAECLDLLDQAQAKNLVQFGDNAQKWVSFICNCCGCCCEAMTAARKFGHMHPVHTTNFLPAVNQTDCTGCGRCAMACPVEALGVVSANDPKQPNRKIARLDEDRCLGCGVCVRNCAKQCITLTARKERVITPLSSTHRAVVMAIERGKLQNLIFDNQVSKSHRAMAAVLGVILKLPPVKQAMASKQMKSRYVETLLARKRA